MRASGLASWAGGRYAIKAVRAGLIGEKEASEHRHKESRSIIASPRPRAMRPGWKNPFR